MIKGVLWDIGRDSGTEPIFRPSIITVFLDKVGASLCYGIGKS